MRLPEYRDDSPLVAEPDEPPFESNIFTLMFFGYPVLGVALIVLFLFAVFG